MSRLLIIALIFTLIFNAFAAKKVEEPTNYELTAGTGRISGNGEGLSQFVVLNGTATLSGSGVLWVTANADIATQGGEVEWKIQKVGSMDVKICENFNGDVVISGDKIAFALRGHVASFTSQGVGRAILQGTGIYSCLNSGDKKAKNGKWYAKPKSKDAKPKYVYFGEWTEEK